MSDYQGSASVPRTQGAEGLAITLAPIHTARTGNTTMAVLWAICGALLAVDAIWLRVTDISIANSGLPRLGLACATLIVMYIVYTRLRPEPGIAAALETILYLAVSSQAGAVLSYLIVGTGAPLVDAVYARADAALGFDWMAWFEFVRAHLWLRTTLAVAYASLLPQMVPLVVVLAFSRRFDDLRAFVAAMTAAMFITLFVSSLFPAAGAWVQYGLGSRVDLAQLSDFDALRSHRLSSINLTHLQGLISMPSFHTALAVLYVWAMRHCPKWFGGFLLLNALLVMSTLSEGGHYLVDVFGGAATSLVSIGFIGYLNSLRPAVTARTEKAYPL